MPIEFHCTECGKLLKTPDDSAGKKGRCPDCGTVMLIPTQSGTGGTTAKSQPSSSQSASAHDPLGLDAFTQPTSQSSASSAYRPPQPGNLGRPAAPSKFQTQGSGSDKASLVLTLGIISVCFGVVDILSCCCCFVALPSAVVALGTGIPAWIVGQGELKRYRRGEYGSNGKSETTSGMICGIIGTCLALLYFILFAASMVLNLAVGGAQSFDRFEGF